MKVSVSIKWIATAINNPEAAGVILGVFVDDPNFTIQGVETHPYMEKFMFYGATYYSEMLAMGEREPTSGNVDQIVIVKDIKARRRLGNVEDSLIMQVGGTGASLVSLNGLSWSSSVLLSLGRR